MVEKKVTKKEAEASKEEKKLEVTDEVKTSKSKVEEILENIEKMTVLELADLVKALEEKFGVTAAMPAMMAANTGNAVQPAAEVEEVEEKTDFEVILKEIGAEKIKVIKEIRAITALGLKESKDLVEGAPKTIKEHVDKKTAEEIKAKLEAVGAVVEIK